MSFVGQDLLHQHTTNINNNNTTQYHIHTDVNIYYAAPCYTFPGYAGLQLPLHTYDDYNSGMSNKNKCENQLAVKIHTSPCYLK